MSFSVSISSLWATERQAWAGKNTNKTNSVTETLTEQELGFVTKYVIIAVKNIIHKLKNTIIDRYNSYIFSIAVFSNFISIES